MKHVFGLKILKVYDLHLSHNRVQYLICFRIWTMGSHAAVKACAAWKKSISFCLNISQCMSITSKGT